MRWAGLLVSLRRGLVPSQHSPGRARSPSQGAAPHRIPRLSVLFFPQHQDIGDIPHLSFLLCSLRCRLCSLKASVSRPRCAECLCPVLRLYKAPNGAETQGEKKLSSRTRARELSPGDRSANESADEYPHPLASTNRHLPESARPCGYPSPCPLHLPNPGTTRREYRVCQRI